MMGVCTKPSYLTCTRIVSVSLQRPCRDGPMLDTADEQGHLNDAKLSSGADADGAACSSRHTIRLYRHEQCQDQVWGCGKWQRASPDRLYDRRQSGLDGPLALPHLQGQAAASGPALRRAQGRQSISSPPGAAPISNAVFACCSARPNPNLQRRGGGGGDFPRERYSCNVCISVWPFLESYAKHKCTNLFLQHQICLLAFHSCHILDDCQC